LSEFGDITLDLPLTRQTWLERSTFRVPAELSGAWLKQLKRWQDYFESGGARFYLTAPIMLEGNSPEIFAPETWQKVERIRERLDRNGTPLQGDLLRATYASLYRYDTGYHANGAGARLRTAELAESVGAFLAGKDTRTRPVMIGEFLPAMKARFTSQKQSFGEGNMPFQIRLRALAALNDQLNSDRRKTGYFPASTSADTWGWPKDVALPDSLPKDQLRYWSDGNGYKLVLKAHRDEATLVAANWPDMVDRASVVDGDLTSATGYGFWSDGQQGR
jgi:hypothetical protein